MTDNDKMAELNRRVCEAIGLEPTETLALSLHFAPGNLLTADIKQIVRTDKAAAVVKAIEHAGVVVMEAVR